MVLLAVLPDEKEFQYSEGFWPDSDEEFPVLIEAMREWPEFQYPEGF